MQAQRRRLHRIVAVQLLAALACTLSSCTLIEFAGDTVVFTGKVVVTIVTTTGKVVCTTAAVGWAGVSYFAGERTVKLEREGDSFFVRVRLNRKHKARLLLDTGASSVQISVALASRMGLDLSKGERVRCTLADGSVRFARSVILKEVRVGRVRVKKVRALVLEGAVADDCDGLLGMSFLGNFVFKIDTQENELILKHKDK